MEDKLRRIWFRFSLRTLFVLVTLFGCAMGWVAYSLNWIRQRREFCARPDVEALVVADGDYSQAPAFLWLFGEKGRGIIRIIIDLPVWPEAVVPADRKRTVEEQTLLDHAKNLFPEAEVQEVSHTYML
jgi:hypothetical protein